MFVLHCPAPSRHCLAAGRARRSLDEGDGNVQLRHALLQRRMRPGKGRQHVPQSKLARPTRRKAVVVVLNGGFGRSVCQVPQPGWSGNMRAGSTAAGYHNRRVDSVHPTCSSAATSASVSCCCRVNRERQYLDVSPGPQGPKQRTMLPGVTSQFHSRVASLAIRSTAQVVGRLAGQAGK